MREIIEDMDIIEKGVDLVEQFGLGMMHPNPKIDRAYKALRVAGFTEEETKRAIQDRVNELVNEIVMEEKFKHKYNIK